MVQHSIHSLSNYHTKWQLITQTETSQYSLCVHVVDACKQWTAHNTFPLTLTLVAHKRTAHERLFSWMLQGAFWSHARRQDAPLCAVWAYQCQNDRTGGFIRPGEHRAAFTVLLQLTCNPITPFSTRKIQQKIRESTLLMQKLWVDHFILWIRNQINLNKSLAIVYDIWPCGKSLNVSFNWEKCSNGLPYCYDDRVLFEKMTNKLPALHLLRFSLWVTYDWPVVIWEILRQSGWQQGCGFWRNNHFKPQSSLVSSDMLFGRQIIL